MKLALLGIDSFLQLASEAAARDAKSDVEVTVVCDASSAAADVLNKHPGAILEGEWENLLASGNFDVLLIGTAGAGEELRTEQLRRFVQDGVNVVLVQPAAEAIVLHELEMIQRDSQSLLVTWNPMTDHPAMRHIRDVPGFGPADTMQHLSIQRCIPGATWPKVQVQLSRDAQLVRQFIGPPDRVTALAPAPSGDTLSNLAVTFVGPTSAIAQWTLSGNAGEDVVTIAAATGQASWRTTTTGDATVEFVTPEGKQEAKWTNSDCEQALGQGLLTFLKDAYNSHQAAKQEQKILTGPMNFDDTSRAVELAEAAYDSNRRSRTIHLHYEEHSEQQTFKSVMAAGGCLLLLGVLFLLAVSIAIDSLGEPVRNNPWWRIWPVYLLAPVVLFLLAQTLWRVFATKPSS